MYPMQDPAAPGRPAPSRVKHEIPMIAAVLGTAVVFALAISLLPGLGRSSPGEAAGAETYKKAHALQKNDPAKALELYRSIGPDAGEWYERARGQVARLQAETATLPARISAEEQKDYDTLLDFWRQNAGDYDGQIRMGEAFVMAHPRGELRMKVEERLAQARQGRVNRRLQEAEETEASVARYLEKRDFSGAILAIEKVSARLRPELDVWPKLAARRDAIIADARRHYLRQADEADRLVKLGQKDEARRLWYSTLRSFGDGRVPELADLCRAVALRSEEIRP